MKEEVTVGEKVLLLRKRRGMESSEFAEKHGISRATLWRIETDKATHIPVSMMKDLLEYEYYIANERGYSEGYLACRNNNKGIKLV